MTTKIRWAPRVPMEWIQRLFELDAQGIEDVELADKVGYRLFDRCRDCIAVSQSFEAPTCPACAAEVERNDEMLRCFQCGWAIDETSYRRSWRHMELSSGGMRPFFETFVSAWRRARSYRDKMLAINDLIHRWHWENVQAERGGVGRPGGVNLIEGSRRQVIDFLTRLTSGPEHDRWARLRAQVERR